MGHATARTKGSVRCRFELLLRHVLPREAVGDPGNAGASAAARWVRPDVRRPVVRVAAGGPAPRRVPRAAGAAAAAPLRGGRALARHEREAVVREPALDALAAAPARARGRRGEGPAPAAPGRRGARRAHPPGAGPGPAPPRPA